MRLCGNCRFYGANEQKDGGLIAQPGTRLTCMHPRFDRGPDPVDGQPIRHRVLASIERSVPHVIALVTGCCGKRGRNFHPKEGA